MSRFIRDKDSTIWRLDLFERFEWEDGYVVRGFRAGDTEGVLFNEAVVREACARYIAAAPGFYTVELNGDDDTIIRSAVVAWRMLEGDVRPITLSEESLAPVQTPDGHVEDIGGSFWKDLQAYRTDPIDRTVFTEEEWDEFAAAVERRPT